MKKIRVFFVILAVLLAALIFSNQAVMAAEKVIKLKIPGCV